MKMSEQYPSKYLKADDLKGREAQVRINYVQVEDVGDDQKPVVYFIGKDRGVVLNRTNSDTITEAYGDESDEWQGKPVILYVDRTVRYAGKITPAIRIKIPEQAAAAPAPRRADPNDFPGDRPMNGTDDEIPW